MNQVFKRKKLKYTKQKYAKYFPLDYQFRFVDFFSACPYSFEELKEKSRKRDLMQWRQLYIFFNWMEVQDLEKAVEPMEMDHANTVHVLKVVMNALEGYDTYLLKKINSILSVREEEFKPSVDSCMNEILSLRLLELKINEQFNLN
jgi:hypothetical protein